MPLSANTKRSRPNSFHAATSYCLSHRPIARLARVSAPFKEIRTWGKKIVLVVNKIDILESEDIEEVLEFVQKAAIRMLDETPVILAFRHARRKRAKADAPGSMASQPVRSIETYIRETLDDVGRFRLSCSIRSASANDWSCGSSTPRRPISTNYRWTPH